MKKKKQGRIYWIAENVYGQMLVFYTLKEARKDGWKKEELVKTREEK